MCRQKCSRKESIKLALVTMAQAWPDHHYLNGTSPPGLTIPHGAQSQAGQRPSQSASNSTEFSSEDSGNAETETSTHLKQPVVKMLLPALNSSQTSNITPKGATVNQTLHACEFCRKSKTKCSGGQPCERCRTYGSQCVYRDGKREKEKKQSVPYPIHFNILLTNLAERGSARIGIMNL